MLRIRSYVFGCSLARALGRICRGTVFQVFGVTGAATRGGAPGAGGAGNSRQSTVLGPVIANRRRAVHEGKGRGVAPRDVRAARDVSLAPDADGAPAYGCGPVQGCRTLRSLVAGPLPNSAWTRLPIK